MIMYNIRTIFREALGNCQSLLGLIHGTAAALDKWITCCRVLFAEISHKKIGLFQFAIGSISGGIFKDTKTSEISQMAD